MDLTVSAKCTVDYQATKTVQGQVGKFATAISEVLALVDGTGAGQVDKIYVDKDKTLAHSTTQSYDLSGSLTDLFGDSCVFAKVKGILLLNLSDDRDVPTTPQLSVGGNTNALVNWISAASDFVVVDAGGWFGIFSPDGYDVTADTGDVLDIENLDGAEEATYTLVIIGTTA